MSDLRVGPVSMNRYRVFRGDKLVAAYSVGPQRPYVYPLHTPAGFPLTEEGPVDHLHHQSVWLGQDEVNDVDFWQVLPGCGTVVGPAPDISVESGPAGDVAIFRHELTWLTSTGAAVLVERRTTAIGQDDAATVVDVLSERTPAAGSVSFGMTKEAGFSLRVLECLDEHDGGRMTGADGAATEAELYDHDTDWVDYSGHIAGHPVGVALFTHPMVPRHPWHARGYGQLCSNPHRFAAQTLAPGEGLHGQWRVVAHDGLTTDADVAALWQGYLAQIDAGLTTWLQSTWSTPWALPSAVGSP